MTMAVGARASAAAGLATYDAKPDIRVSQMAAMLVYAPEQVKYTHASQAFALVAYSTDIFGLPRDSSLAALVVYSTNVFAAPRSRAWTFTLDGHTFYVLDLGGEGTFLYDITTQQWCQFQTAGHAGWNLHNGVVFKEGRIAGGDETSAQMWELAPDFLTDDGFRPITHIVTGGMATRSRVYKAVEAVRITGSIGILDDANDAFFIMRFSDDNGQTWASDYVVDLTDRDFGGEIAWRSLGSFMAPGRIFEFEDQGGLLRIDGADLFIENFDGVEAT